MKCRLMANWKSYVEFKPTESQECDSVGLMFMGRMEAVVFLK